MRKVPSHGEMASALAHSADGTDREWVEAAANSIRNTLGINSESYPFATSKELKSAIQERTVNAAFKSGMQSYYPHPEGYLVQAYDSSAADGKGLNNGDYKSTRSLCRYRLTALSRSVSAEAWSISASNWSLL